MTTEYCVSPVHSVRGSPFFVHLRTASYDLPVARETALIPPASEIACFRVDLLIGDIIATFGCLCQQLIVAKSNAMMIYQ